MVPKTVIISFGCPRSGTTFLARCLSSLVGVFAFHFPDGAKLHPTKHNDGLIQLDALFWHHRTIWVRIVRHPLDIAESFLALRMVTPEGARAKDSDPQIVRWIVNEHKHVRVQRKLLQLQDPAWEPHHLIEVRYEDLAQAKGREAFAEELTALLPRRDANPKILLDELATFGVKPANMGKLRAIRMDKLEKGPVMTPTERVYFEKELATVIIEGGYGAKP